VLEQILLRDGPGLAGGGNFAQVERGGCSLNNFVERCKCLLFIPPKQTAAEWLRLWQHAVGPLGGCKFHVNMFATTTVALPSIICVP
jgi:hypothetical protein